MRSILCKTSPWPKPCSKPRCSARVVAVACRASPPSDKSGAGDAAGGPAPYGASYELAPESFLDPEDVFGNNKVEAGLVSMGDDEDEDEDEEAGFIDLDADEEELPEGFWDMDRERVYLVGAAIKRKAGPRNLDSAVAQAMVAASGNVSEAVAGYGIDESLEELGRLADTAGLKVVGNTFQILNKPNRATYIGSGKVAEIAETVRAYKIETVIFDDALSPGQLRNLEKAFAGEEGLEVKVCDRTALILDIFSQRAQTREGKLQVELAQTEYQLPRLTRMWSHLDRVGGGGQVKGTGEKQRETDRRLLKERIAELKKELETVRVHRRNYRERRQTTPIPTVAIVGYTNAGKSTLLNTLTNAGVLAEDKLFATLDNTARRIRLKGNHEIIISDTVGFIQKLPTELVAAFRATLEETRDATIILHVVDISHPNAAQQSKAVDEVLATLDVGSIPIITAWNKLDNCLDPDEVRSVAKKRAENVVCISGQTGEGLPEVLSIISNMLADAMIPVEVMLPYGDIGGDLLNEMHRHGQVRNAEYTEDGVTVSGSVPPSVAGRLVPYSLMPIEITQANLNPALAEVVPAEDPFHASWDSTTDETLMDAMV